MLLDLPKPETIRAYRAGLPREVVAKYATFPQEKQPRPEGLSMTPWAIYRRKKRAEMRAKGLNSNGKKYTRKEYLT